MVKRLIYLVYIYLLFFHMPASAQTPEIINGLNYLTSTQNPDSSWGDDTSDTDILPATVSVIETLQVLEETSSQDYIDAVSWLQSQSLETTDYLSERIYALSASGTDEDLLLSYLDEIYTDAWGGYDDFEANNLDTTLAILALNEINHPDLETIGYALGYLINSQNTDGGWAFRQAQGDETNESNVYMTAYVLKSLISYDSTFNIQDSINNAVTYLLAMQNPDGGFPSTSSGQGSGSTVYVTALAFEALVASGADASTGTSSEPQSNSSGQIFQNAIDYLITSQLSDGSWNNDPYSTALAIRALANVKPNLSITSSDITFSNPAPTVGETITITAIIHNTGLEQAPSTGSGYITVQFYDGDPDAGGVFISETTIPSIAPYSTATVEVDYDTTGKYGRHDIYVIIDPADTIEELNETDNRAASYLTIFSLPDLYINSSEITYSPTNPTADVPLRLTFIVRNLGEKGVANILTRLYSGPPEDGGVASSEYTISALGAKGGYGVTATIYSPLPGVNTFYLVVDPDNAIMELNETNNMGSVTVEVEYPKSTDLSIYPVNISFSQPVDAKPGDRFTINAVVNNTGSTNITTDAAFYDGNPASGGIFIGRKTITIPAIGNQIAQMAWILPEDKTTIYVVVDPDNIVPETNETNNIAYREVTPSSLMPDFVVHSAEISYHPSSPTPNSYITVAAVVHNYGGTASHSGLSLYRGDPDSGGVRMGQFVTFTPSAYLEPYSYAVTEMRIPITLPLGEHEFYVVADPYKQIDEIDETNNKGVIMITVTENAENDLYISGKDITFSPALPLDGEQVTITANVHNSGSENINAYYVAFYNGDPLDGGQLIGRVNNWAPQEGSRAVSTNFTMTGGIPEIYVVVDDDNQIQEINEDNNTASRTIDTYKVDLSVSLADITLVPVLPQKGEMVGVNVTVHSAGAINTSGTLMLYDVKSEADVLIGSQDFVTDGNQSVTLNLSSYTYPGNGATLTAVIENVTPADEDLTNNRATVIFGEHIEDGASNEGTDFWVGWPDVARLTAKIVIQSKHIANVTVKAPSFERQVVVSPLSPAIIPLKNYVKDKVMFTDGVVEDKGIHITSDRDISVIFHSPLHANSADDSYLAFPTDMLGTEYYFLSYTAYLAASPSQYLIVSTADNTNVDVNGIVVNMNRGQTYQVKQGAADHSGSYIRSDKPIALIAGIDCVNITADPFTPWCDSLLEEMLPVSLLGTDYYTAPLYSPVSPDVFRVLAVEDNTEITIKDKYSTETISLNSSEWAEYEREDATHITSNMPIMVAQFAKGYYVAQVGDPFQMTIIPTDKLKTEYRFYTHGLYEGGDFVTVIAPEPETTVMLDVGILSAEWLPLPDKGNYVVIPITEGEHVITADKPVAVYSHGYREYGSYGYPAGLALPISNLSLDSININPETPLEGQLVVITGSLTNNGKKWAKDVLVRVYNGDPLNEGVQIGEDIYLDFVYPNESKTVQFAWDTYGYMGTNNIYVVADPLDTIKESNEADNTAMITVEVTATLKPDPTVTEPDITLSQEIVNEGDIVTLSARIKNRGTDVGNIPVSLYLGDPENGGILLESQIIKQILPLYGEVILEFTFNTIGFADINDLYVVIDPEDIIDELIEGNNTAFAQLKINRKKLSLEVETDKTRYQAESDVGINVYIKNESMLSWSGTGDVYIEDPSGSQVAHVATFTVDDLKPTGIEGWHHRAPITVTESREMKDAIAIAYINFNDLFLSLDIAGKTIDINSVRVLEFDSTGNFSGEKNARFEKSNGFDIVTNPSGRLLWLINGTTPANTPRYFYLYFDTAENGPKAPSVNTSLPYKGRLIAFSDLYGSIYTVTSNADVTFGEEVFVDKLTGYNDKVLGITLADFNNNGFPDIITGTAYQGDIYYYRNKADGTDTFLPKEKIGNIGSGSNLQAITSADYNNDGNQDFILNMSGSNLYLFSGNGDGTFTQTKMTEQTRININGKASADFDMDGNIDLVVGDNYDGVFIYYGNGDGTFEDPVEIADVGKAHGIAAADFDNDGYLDVIMNNGYQGNGYIIKGGPGGIFEPAEYRPFLKTSHMTAYDVADFNGDGNQDLIAVQYNPSELFYFEGNGDGNFKLPVNIPTNSSLATAVSASRINPEVLESIGIPEGMPSMLFNFIWNTGSTPPGDYKVHVTLSEGQGVIAEGNAPFEILPDIRVDSSVVTDKISYNANEIVTITSRVTSLSENTIISNLTAQITITDSNGTGLYTETNTIAILTPGQLTELKTYWNTGQNPEGTYTVTLEVFEGITALSTSTAAFDILGTEDTGEGIIGTISASPDPVYQGQDETLTYTITNSGNEDINNLNVKVLIVNPETEELKTTLEGTINLPMNTTITGDFISSTIDLTPRVYLAILQVSSALMTGPKTLDSATFEVEPSLEITKTIPDLKNVLVWLNYPWDTGQDTPDRLLIEQALTAAGVNYYIVLDKKDFQTELRNPYYTDFLILGEHNPIEDHFSEELREQVYSGKGLISSMFHRQNLDEDVFGIEFRGYLSDRDYLIELTESEISTAGDFQSYGTALRVEIMVEAESILGWIVETTDRYPGIIKNEYGDGKVLFFSFDFGLSSQNYSLFEALLGSSLSYIHTPIDTTAFHPDELVPVEIEIKSLGGVFDLRITETYPAEIKIYDPVTDQWITDNPWIVELQLEPDETKTVLYYALTPDTAGTYTLETEVGYIEDGDYNFYQSLSIEIVVDRDADTMVGDIITELNAFSVSGQDRAKVNNAIRYMENVRERVIVTDNDIERNIDDILKAIGSLLSVTSVDIADVRLMMDGLLEVWEGRYYR